MVWSISHTQYKDFSNCLLLLNKSNSKANYFLLQTGEDFLPRELWWKKRDKQKVKIIQTKVEFYHGFLSWKVWTFLPLLSAPFVIFTKFKIKWIIQRRDTMARSHLSFLPLFRVVRVVDFWRLTIKTHPPPSADGRGFNRRHSRIFHLATRLLPTAFTQSTVIHGTWIMRATRFQKTRRETRRACTYFCVTHAMHRREKKHSNGREIKNKKK